MKHSETGLFGVQFGVWGPGQLPALQKALETQMLSNKNQVVCLWPSGTNPQMWISLVFIILNKLRICVFKCRIKNS